jgi:transcriptional regulator with XRE-family HTH domain
MSSKNEDILKNLESLLVFDSEKDKLELEAELLHLKFVKVVEKLMEHEGMTKAELAHELSTSKSYITQLFSGSKLLNIKTLVKLQHALNFNFNISAENWKPAFLPLKCKKFIQPFNHNIWESKDLGNKYEFTKPAKKIRLIA